MDEPFLNGNCNSDDDGDPDLMIINDVADELGADQLLEICGSNRNNILDSNVDSEDSDCDESVFQFTNVSCYICNGYYGPCFEDPVCSTCHAFLFPSIPPNLQTVSVLEDQGDDGDSGNDEPSDIGYRRTGFGDRNFDESELIAVPAVQVEELDHHIIRISEPQHIVQVNIETLPPEVLMQVFAYLDDISLWAVGQVSVRWNEILNMHIREERWRNFTLLRWPLYKSVTEHENWYNVYSSLMESCTCSKCILQMAAQEFLNVEENSWRTHRLRSELRVMRMDPLEGIQALPLDSLCRHWQATILGPSGSPYEGGLFFLYIQIPHSYPMSPPVVRFLTKIFHPNISRHGDIGIDSIHHNWSLALTISKVLLSVQSLLTDPYCDICMEPDIGALYLQDRASYERQVRLWTQKYAMVDLNNNY